MTSLHLQKIDANQPPVSSTGGVAGISLDEEILPDPLQHRDDHAVADDAVLKWIGRLPAEARRDPAGLPHQAQQSRGAFPQLSLGQAPLSPAQTAAKPCTSYRSGRRPHVRWRRRTRQAPSLTRL